MNVNADMAASHLLGCFFFRQAFPENQNDRLPLTLRESIDLIPHTEPRPLRRANLLAIIGFAQRRMDFIEFPFAPYGFPYSVLDLPAVSCAFSDGQKRISEDIVVIVPPLGPGFGELMC